MPMKTAETFCLRVAHLRSASLTKLPIDDETAKWFARRAGLTPWPRAFHNLRSSRVTELGRDYPVRAAADWLGHDNKVAAGGLEPPTPGL